RPFRLLFIFFLFIFVRPVALSATLSATLPVADSGSPAALAAAHVALLGLLRMRALRGGDVRRDREGENNIHTRGDACAAAGDGGRRGEAGRRGGRFLQ